MIDQVWRFYCGSIEATEGPFHKSDICRRPRDRRSWTTQKKFASVNSCRLWVVALPFSPILTIHSTQQSSTSTTRSLSILGACFSLGRFECRRSSRTAANVSLRCHSPTARISRPSCGCDFIQYMQINCVERLFVLSCCRTTTLKWSRAVDGAGSKGGSNKISLTRFLAKRDDYFALYFMLTLSARE